MRENKQEQNNKWVKINLYVLSLSILFVCILIARVEISKTGVLKYWTENYILIFCAFGLLWSVYSFFYLCYLKGGAFENPRKVSKATNISYENLSFLTSYLVPLVSISEPLIVIILVCLVAVMQIRANLFYTNPILAIFGFQLYQVQFERSDEEYIVIVRGNIAQGNGLERLYISRNILYVKNLTREKISNVVKR